MVYVEEIIHLLKGNPPLKRLQSGRVKKDKRSMRSLETWELRDKFSFHWYSLCTFTRLYTFYLFFTTVTYLLKNKCGNKQKWFQLKAKLYRTFWKIISFRLNKISFHLKCNYITVIEMQLSGHNLLQINI